MGQLGHRPNSKAVVSVCMLCDHVINDVKEALLIKKHKTNKGFFGLNHGCLIMASDYKIRLDTLSSPLVSQLIHLQVDKP